MKHGGLRCGPDPVVQRYNIQGLVCLCLSSAPQCWLHPRADPHHGHRMMTSSNLTSNGKQRALSHNRRKTSWTLWWLGHLSAAIQVIGEIPSANWLRPMICSTNHGGTQGGINPIVLDQSGPTPLAACGENATPSRRLLHSGKAAEGRAELHPNYQWRRRKGKLETTELCLG